MPDQPSNASHHYPHHRSDSLAHQEKRVSVRVACQECRTRKSKCDGGRPQCQNCIKKQSPCHYEAAPDETRVGALKRKYAELQRQTSEQERFMQLLKATASDQDAFELVRRVRAGQDVSAIVKSTASATSSKENRHETRPQPPDRNRRSAGSEAAYPASRGPSPSRRFSISSLLTTTSDSHISEIGSEKSSPDSSGLPFLSGEDCSPQAVTVASTSPNQNILPGHRFDSPGDQQPKRRRNSSQSSGAGPFTFNHRTSLALLGATKGPLRNIRAVDWDVDYIGDAVFQEIVKSFLYWDHPTWAIFDEIAFRDGLLAGGSEYCNKFLVQMVIAYASKIYGSLCPGRVDSAEQHAIEKAQQLWQTESTNPIPANITGALILNAYLACTGQEKIPSSPMKQAVFLAEEMGLYSAKRASEVYDPAQKKQTRSRAVLAWGLFAHQAYFTCFFNQPPLLTTFPPIPIPEAEPAEDNELWTPFPMQGPRKPCCSSTRFVARASLWSIGNDIMPLHRRYEHKQGSSEHIMNAIAMYDRLRAWHDSLDIRLLRLYDAPPHLFQLHTDYQRATIELFRPFLDIPVSKRYDWPDGAYEQALRVSIASHRQVRFLLQELDRQFKDLPIPLETVTPLVLVAHDTIIHLTSDPDNREHVYFICLCLKMLLRMAESFSIVPFVVQGILQVAKRQGVELPAEARAIANQLKQDRFQGAPAASINTTLPVDLGLMQIDEQGSRLEFIIKEIGRSSVE